MCMNVRSRLHVQTLRTRIRWHIVSHSIPFWNRCTEAILSIHINILRAHAREQWINTINKELLRLHHWPASHTPSVHRSTANDKKCEKEHGSSQFIVHENEMGERQKKRELSTERATEQWYSLECHKLYWCFRAKRYLKNFTIQRKALDVAVCLCVLTARSRNAIFFSLSFLSVCKLWEC